MSLLERASAFERSGTERAMFVFSYDIASPKNARAVRRVLKRWRLDGQLSVHEAIVTPGQAESLGVELAELVDPETDSLMVFRLCRRGHGPIMVLSAPNAPSVAQPNKRVPNFPADGTYVLAYDVRDVKRLRRVHRETSKEGIFVQRSVYLYQGSGASLVALVARIRALLDETADDCRVYALSGADDLWFFVGGPPPLAGLGASIVAGEANG
jgi:CRISPR-associated endonuclease Cas2